MVMLFYLFTFLTACNYTWVVFWGLILVTYAKLMLNKSFLLNSLLCLELIVMLSILLILFSALEVNSSAIMMFITLSVCEAVAGLSIVIFISRFKEIEMININ